MEQPQITPDRLATVAALHALPAPGPLTSRVLELGCGAGGSLLAIAVAAPGVTALGVDPVAERVAEGSRAIAELGLGNVELRQAGESTLTEGRLGEFDFVIARGRSRAVLAACHSHLAADGLAHVHRAPGRVAPLAYVGDGDFGDLLAVPVAGPRGVVLCRDSRTPSVAPDPGSLRGLHFAARGEDTGTGDPLLASAVTLLRAQAPETVGFAQLRAALGADPDALGELLLAGLRAGVVTPHTVPLRVVAVTDVERPAASPFARRQARLGAEVTSLAHTSVRMQEPAARLLLTLLDGTRDRPEIRAEFGERTGVRLSPEDLDANLARLARLFLLTG